MKTIKHIAGDVLLYFYALQRKHGFALTKILSFEGIHSGSAQLNTQDSLCIDLLSFADQEAASVYGALQYLKEKSFLEFRNTTDTASDSLHDFHVTAYGVDIIEGIERGENEKKEFNLNFNIKLADTITVESLLKAELGSVLKAFIGG